MTLCRQFRMALLRDISIDMIWGSPPSQDAFTQPSHQVDRFGGNEALTFQALWSGPFFFCVDKTYKKLENKRAQTVVLGYM